MALEKMSLAAGGRVREFGGPGFSKPASLIIAFFRLKSPFFVKPSLNTLATRGIERWALIHLIIL